MGHAPAHRLLRGLARSAISLAAVAVVVAVYVFFPHFPKVIVSCAALMVLLAGAWWGGYIPGAIVTLSLMLVVPFYTTKDFHLAKANFSSLTLLLLLSLLVSFVAASRRKVEAALRRHNETLDERVRQRTDELQRANEALRERETQLLRQAEQLSHSNAHLEQFAYVASHDLQEPLRMIAIYTELIERRCAGQFDEEAERYMKTVVEGVRRMEHLIRDLLSYSRAIHVTSAPEPTDAGETLRAAIMNLQSAISETGASVQFGDLPVVEVDRVLLTQVFQNLLSNALKYRGPAPPRIDIQAELRDGQWTFSVRDNGIGIHANYHETIFSPFKRLHSNRYPGTGVGLAICRQVIDRLGGRIWVESTPGSGSTFYFTVPASAVDSGTVAAAAS